ncbi:MAG: hypothetical protein WBM44_07050 [Waterburya sp.]
MKILFLAANPQSTSRLNLGKEVQEIEDGLRRSKLSDRFRLVQRWEVRPRDIRRALLEENPDIVHFSGPDFSRDLFRFSGDRQISILQA